MRSRIDTADLGTVRLAYRTWGPEDAPPLVLLHSLGEQSETWGSFADAMHERYHVVAPDLRGHGLSDRTDSYAIDRMADDILRLIDQLGLDTVSLIGHSLGAMIAYVLAPAADRVRMLVLEEPPSPDPPPEPRPLPRRDASVACDWAAVEEVYRQRNHPDPRWAANLGVIEARSLVIAGGPKSHLDQDEMRSLAHRIPGCRFTSIPGGHFVHRRRPEAFTATVAAFLTGELEDEETGWSHA